MNVASFSTPNHPSTWSVDPDYGVIEFKTPQDAKIAEGLFTTQAKEIAALRAINAELLAACEACVRALRPIEESDRQARNPATKALIKACAAIAKAKG